ncbi:hypothetical protein CMUS01_06695 [Colletotrichum musicola]|uniref:Uncharacterized protein n=1 Tax=Colletotrichum musicola TaxID=2175873 RepID=A0A8H6NHG7_9PEZI|nr:hypothetical protein CMUS01_06695 [Colletotrichum musicola]
MTVVVVVVRPSLDTRFLPADLQWGSRVLERCRRGMSSSDGPTHDTVASKMATRNTFQDDRREDGQSCSNGAHGPRSGSYLLTSSLVDDLSGELKASFPNPIKRGKQTQSQPPEIGISAAALRASLLAKTSKRTAAERSGFLRDESVRSH